MNMAGLTLCEYRRIETAIYNNIDKKDQGVCLYEPPDPF